MAPPTLINFRRQAYRVGPTLAAFSPTARRSFMARTMARGHDARINDRDDQLAPRVGDLFGKLPQTLVHPELPSALAAVLAPFGCAPWRTPDLGGTHNGPAGVELVRESRPRHTSAGVASNPSASGLVEGWGAMESVGVPVVVIATTDAASREIADAELRRRYGGDYEIVTCVDYHHARAVLDGLRRWRRPVAMILACYNPDDRDGLLFLRRARAVQPTAKRGPGHVGGLRELGRGLPDDR
jgi:hypothetical protein